MHFHGNLYFMDITKSHTVKKTLLSSMAVKSTAVWASEISPKDKFSGSLTRLQQPKPRCGPSPFLINMFTALKGSQFYFYSVAFLKETISIV